MPTNLSKSNDMNKIVYMNLIRAWRQCYFASKRGDKLMTRSRADYMKKMRVLKPRTFANFVTFIRDMRARLKADKVVTQETMANYPRSKSQWCTCKVCEKTFFASRCDAKFCSSKCRVKQHRVTHPASSNAKVVNQE